VADEQALLTTLTTEHFTLQGARASTVSESGARSALYLGSVSSALVALGFVAQVSQAGELFRVFALVVLPTLFVLGLFTFIRLVESSIEDILYGRAINRIRHYYLERAGEQGRYFLMGAHDDPLGVVRNMGIRPSRWQLYFTAASAIAVVNSVVGGTAVGLAVGIAVEPVLGVSVAAGLVFAALSYWFHQRLERARHEAGVDIEPLFPSPAE
jgi:hypothetical protein